MTALLRREVLIGLLVLLVGGGAYVTGPWSADEQAPARQQAPAARAAQAATAVDDVRLDLLTATGGDAATVSRNPFRFQQRAVPASTTRRTAPRPEFTPPPVPTGPPPPPPITLRFIGLIEAPPRTGRVALLSDGRGGLMYGREGDTVDGRYRMLRVGIDSIEMAYMDGRGRQTIRLSGQ
ncbi:MAG TPA: hypothetical protein VFD69_02555 [Vicinamibacterales bacterium]|nr:hypothetical protein [Vicinamibacterales bacterium]